MPHKSRFCAFGIDCEPGRDLDAATAFWSAALGRPAKPADPESPTYRSLDARATEPQMFVQAVPHASRVHLDIETNDVDAEVARLEQLGAKKIEKRHTWWVMEAPTGHRFCVVREQRGPLGDDANVWP